MQRPFFNVFFPEASVSKTSRFFFFTTLLGPNYSKQLGQQYLGQNLKLEDQFFKQRTFKGNAFPSVFEQIKSFVKKEVEFEKANEKSYFQKLLDSKDLSPRLKQQLTKALQSNDYFAFTAIINYLLYGSARNSEAVISYEQERLKILQNLREEYKQLSLSKKKEYAEKYAKRQLKEAGHYSELEQGLQQYIDETLAEYRKSTKRSERKKAFIATRGTVNEEVYKMVNKLLRTIISRQDIIDRIKNFVIIGNPRLEQLEHEVTAYIASAFVNLMSGDIIKTFLSHITSTKNPALVSPADDPKVIEQLTNKLNNYLIALEFENNRGKDYSGIEKNNLSKERMRHMEAILTYAKMLQYGEIERKNFKDTFLEVPNYDAVQITPMKNRQRDTISGLATNDSEFSRDLINIMTVLIEEEKAQASEEERKKLEKRYSSVNNKVKVAGTSNQYRDPTLRDKAMRLVKLYFRHHGHKEIANSHGDINQKVMLSVIREVLTGGKEPLLTFKLNAQKAHAELTANQGIQTNISSMAQSYFIHPHKAAKSDGIIVQVGTLTGTINTSAVDKYVKEITDHILTNVTEAYQSVSDVPVSQTLQHQYQIRRITQSIATDYQPTEFNVTRNTNRIYQKLEDMINAKRYTGSGSKKRNRFRQQSIAETIIINNSVKDYKKEYTIKGAFQGGSIGGSVEHQIENIDTMARLGGIALPDKEWLISAVYNAGPGLIGKKNKNLLESMFSGIAAFLLFEDYGAINMLKAVSAANKSNAIDGNFLHLYTLNGVYVPASFVLERTLTSLLELDEKTNKISSNGVHVQIKNPVNITNMVVGAPNSQSTGNQKKTYVSARNERGRFVVTSPQDWYDTFDANKDKVSINIIFLAGFLDILDQLNQEMSKIAAVTS